MVGRWKDERVEVVWHIISWLAQGLLVVEKGLKFSFEGLDASSLVLNGPVFAGDACVQEV